MRSSKGNEGAPGGGTGLLGRLKSAGLVPRKSLGQHFLHDPSILASLVESAGVDKGSHVLEIGTGPGTLTRELASRSSSVLTVEIDERMGAFAAAELEGFDNIEILQLDALDNKRKLRPLLLERLEDLGEFTWVSNLPYKISTTVIIALMESAVSWQRAVLTVQLEVADAVAAAAALEARECVSRCEARDGRRDVAVQDVAQNLPAIFAAAGDIASFSVRNTTLDDVFLHYTGHDIRNEGAEGVAKHMHRVRSVNR